MGAPHDSWTVEPADVDSALAGFLRARLPGRSWNEVKRLCATGKVFVGDERVVDPGRRLRQGDFVSVRMTAPRPRDGHTEVRLVHDDAQLVVVDKPSGISSVPYQPEDTGTAMDLVRDAWRRQGRPATDTALHVVHRIDKDTSGLLLFAKTKRAEIGLAAQFRAHSVERTYLCVAHGAVRAARIESALVTDRGDGLRGSARRGQEKQGKRAVTHVAPVEPLRGATLCEVRLETGKTHQIRIHLAERGHPLVGETVYIRDYQGTPIVSPRLLLHAATLGFVHPLTQARLTFQSELPDDFLAILRGLRR